MVRTEGGDDVFGVDDRADRVLLAELARLGERWPGTVVLEGYDDPVPVGPTDADGQPGPWRYLADPVDGTRPYLAGKRSAWVLLGAGRQATTLEQLEVGAAVEIPTVRRRGRPGGVGHDDRRPRRGRGGPPRRQLVAVDDDLLGDRPADAGRAAPADRSSARSQLRHRRAAAPRRPRSDRGVGRPPPRRARGLRRPRAVHRRGDDGPGLGRRSGRVRPSSAVAPRQHWPPTRTTWPPWWWRGPPGAVIEALPPGPLLVPLDTGTGVAWAGYADEATAVRLRPTDL